MEPKPGAKPVHHHACPVLQVHRQIFKKELDYMVELSIFETCGASEWVFPVFIIRKKMGMFNRSMICIPSTKLSYVNNISFQPSQICWTASLDIIFSTNLTFPCNIVPLKLMNQAKNFVSLSYHSASKNTNNTPGTQMCCQLWSTSYGGGSP